MGSLKGIAYLDHAYACGVKRLEYGQCGVESGVSRAEIYREDGTVGLGEEFLYAVHNLWFNSLINCLIFAASLSAGAVSKRLLRSMPAIMG